MGWEDRPYYRDRGYSSNPLSALLSGSVPLFTAFSIRVRAHSALIVFILCELLLDWTPGYNLAAKLVSMGMLFGVVLLHEFGHCFAARSVGGWASEILLWPLGGLAFPETPQRPAARFWTAAGGPLVNVAICLASAWGVWVLAGHMLVTFNPLHGLLPPEKIGWRSPAFYLWWIFVTSYLLLLLNILPIYPLDGGRMVQTVLWKFVGYDRSRLISCTAGMFGSVAIALAGVMLMLLDQPGLFLLLLAAFLFYCCFQERKMLQEAGPGEPWQEEEADYSSNLYRDPQTSRRRRASKKAVRIARKRAKQGAAERERLDAILAKVSAQGLNSLTWRERRVLRVATEQRRRQENEMKGILEE